MRMNVINTLGTVTLVTMLSACSGDSGGGSKSVDTSGNCTQEFLTNYNSVSYEANAAKNSIDLQQSEAEVLKKVKKLKNACEKFFSQHTGVQCKAEVDYKETTIASTDHTQRCEAAQTILDESTAQ